MILYVARPTWPRALAAGIVALAGAGLIASACPAAHGCAVCYFAWLLTRRMSPETGRESNAEPSEDVVAEGRVDWLSVVMIGLLGFMAWLSYDYVRGMLPPEMGILRRGRADRPGPGRRAVGAGLPHGQKRVTGRACQDHGVGEPQRRRAWPSWARVLRTGRVVIDLPPS